MNRLMAHVRGLGGNVSQVMRARLPWVVVAWMLGIQAWVEWSGGVQALAWIYEHFGLSRQGMLSGWVWTIFTYGWLHGNWLHVSGNCLCLLLLGSRIEHYLGAERAFRVMMLSLLGGGLLHLAIGPGGDSTGPLVGSSAACFGLLLLLTTLSPQSVMWPLPISARSLGLGFLIVSLLLALMVPALGVPVLSGWGNRISRNGMEGWWSIGHACHLGGGLAGWLYGRWVLRPRVTLSYLRRERARREAARLRH